MSSDAKAAAAVFVEVIPKAERGAACPGAGCNSAPTRRVLVGGAIVGEFCKSHAFRAWIREAKRLGLKPDSGVPPSGPGIHSVDAKARHAR